jgi:hypothetical protein
MIMKAQYGLPNPEVEEVTVDKDVFLSILEEYRLAQLLENKAEYLQRWDYYEIQEVRNMGDCNPIRKQI